MVMKGAGLILVGLLFCGTAFAQFRAANNSGSQNRNKSDQDIQNRFYFGGGGSFGAGTGYNYYSIFPIVGYRITQPFSVGTGISYQRYNYTLYNPSISLSQYGVTPFARYSFNPLFFQTELDLINAPLYDNSTNFSETERKWFTRLLFGVGYGVPMGRRGGLNALIMYDVLYKTPSVFASPIVARVFFTF
jgi:hypothetical protein